jgi:PD-(D/E)XK nuclease superfamily
MEDFHTEIVAQVLRNSDPFTIAWLRGIEAANPQMSEVISIRTQERFAALEENQPGSRVDMVIRLSGNGQRQMVFVESKIGSTENPGQLSEYAGVIRKLQAELDYSEIVIVYITRDFEMLPPDVPADVVRQCRWFHFYNHLRAQTNPDGLAEQLKLFMEENKMAVRNQFTAIDSVALSNFLSAQALMRETLWGTGVHEEFKRTLGKVSSEKECMKQLRDHQRYVMYVDLGSDDDFECILGYYLPNGDPTEPTWVGVWLCSNWKSRIRKDVILAFRDFAKKNSGWKGKNLDDEKEWSSIAKAAELHSFMAQSDHIKAIKDYFLTLLSDVKRFKSQHPELPWSTSTVDDADDR